MARFILHADNSRKKDATSLAPGKSHRHSKTWQGLKSCGQLSLLSVCFKLLERLVLYRISPVLEKTITDEQAGFRQGRSTGDQVLALTTYIENGFQQNQKTGTVFLDLTAAYDTVWFAGLLLKLSKVLPCWVVEAIELFFHDRCFSSTYGRQKQLLEKTSKRTPTGIRPVSESLQHLY